MTRHHHIAFIHPPIRYYHHNQHDLSICRQLIPSSAMIMILNVTSGQVLSSGVVFTVLHPLCDSWNYQTIDTDGVGEG